MLGLMVVMRGKRFLGVRGCLVWEVWSRRDGSGVVGIVFAGIVFWGMGCGDGFGGCFFWGGAAVGRS